MENRIGFKGQEERELLAYEWEVAGFVDSLYEVLLEQEPSLWRAIMGSINNSLYNE